MPKPQGKKKVWTVLKGERKTSVWIDKRGTAWVGDVAGEIVLFSL